MRVGEVSITKKIVFLYHSLLKCLMYLQECYKIFSAYHLTFLVGLIGCLQVAV